MGMVNKVIWAAMIGVIVYSYIMFGLFLIGAH